MHELILTNGTVLESAIKYAVMSVHIYLYTALYKTDFFFFWAALQK